MDLEVGGAVKRYIDGYAGGLVGREANDEYIIDRTGEDLALVCDTVFFERCRCNGGIKIERAFIEFARIGRRAERYRRCHKAGTADVANHDGDNIFARL